MPNNQPDIEGVLMRELAPGECGCFDCRVERGEIDESWWTLDNYEEPEFDCQGGCGQKVRGQMFCPECEWMRNPIKQYSEDVLKYCKADEIKNGKRLHGRLYGAEIELYVKSTHDRTKVVKDMARYGKDTYILKADSSVGNNGFEVVTRPMTAKNLTKFWVEFCKQDFYNKLGCNSTCGIHIHVTKRSLSQLALGKTLMFANKDNNQEFITWVAKRYSERYAKFFPFKLCRSGLGSYESSGKYTSINVSKPQTIEFRIFAGSLKLKEVLSYFQFVESALDFCEQARLEATKLHGISGVSWVRYLQYLNSTPKNKFADLKERVRDIQTRGKFTLPLEVK